MKVELLEILGVACLATFAFFVYMPLPLLVVGVACIIIAARLAGGGDKS